MRECPWCKHDKEDDIIPINQADEGCGYEGWQMRCEWCGARGPESRNSKQAYESWEDRK